MGNTSVGDDAAAGTGNAAKADDLLAQLAGDEIDRLLADADEIAEAANAAANTPPDIDDKELVQSASDEASVEAAAVAPAVLEAIDAPIPPIKPPAGAAKSAESRPGASIAADPTAEITAKDSATRDSVTKDPVAKETDSALAGELDKLFDELKKEPAPDVTDAPAGLVDSEPEPAPAETAASVAETPAVAVDDGTTAEERGGLIEESAEESSAETSLLIEQKLPVYLKPLLLINAPFSFLPDRVRDLFGTIGIVTFMNAVAILAYIRFLRKH